MLKLSSDIRYLNIKNVDSLNSIFNELSNIEINEIDDDNDNDNNFFTNFNKLELNKYDNYEIAISLTNFIKNKLNINNTRLNTLIILNILNHISKNIYNTVDYYKTQMVLVNSLFIYTSKLSNPLEDIIFYIFIDNINWNDSLCIYLLKLLCAINYYDCFIYIYIRFGNCKYAITLINFLSNYNDDGIEGNIKCITIFNYLLDQIISDKLKIQLIDQFYDNMIKIDKLLFDNKMIIYLDCYNLCIEHKSCVNYINNNNNIYKYLNKIDNSILYDTNLLINKAFKSVIINSIESRYIIDDIIEKYNIDPNIYIIDALKYCNYFYINNYIDYRKLSSYTNDILLIISKYNIYSLKLNKIFKWKIIFKLVDNLIKIGYVSELTFNQINQIMINAIKYNNKLIIYKIFPILVNKDRCKIKYLLNHSLSRYMFQIVMRLLNRYKLINNYNGDDMIDIYTNNYYLIRYLIQYNKLKKATYDKIFIKILSNNIDTNKKYILALILSHLSSNSYYDINICKLLYKKKCYDLLCSFLIKTRNKCIFTFDNIQKSYPKLIDCNNFYRLNIN